MSTDTRLKRSFADAPVLSLDDSSRYVLISDCHRGNGSNSDNFLKNQHLYFAALQHYYDHGYTYIELGDGADLWKNRSMKQIIDVHSNVFWLLSKYYSENRVYLLHGNHDIVKKNSRICSDCFATWFSTEHQCEIPLFPNVHFYSGLILQDAETDTKLYLTHGHQAELLNSTFWPLARFLVRHVWTRAENMGFLDPTSAAKNNTRKHATGEKLTRWAKKNGHILITGHTHRPMIGSADSPYFNTGSCVHPRCITCIEISHRRLTLVKWTVYTSPDMTLYVGREILGDPVSLDALNR